MTTKCCTNCYSDEADCPGACECHQTHTTKEGWEQDFDEWAKEAALVNNISHGGEHCRLCGIAPSRLKAFIASEITKAQVEERMKISQLMFEEHSKALSLIMLPSVANREAQVIYNTFNMIFQAIQARITNKQSEV